MALNDAPEGAVARCYELITDLDDTVAEFGHADQQDRRIQGYPYLRVNRFLASYRLQATGAAFEQWLTELQALALTGWAIEYRNLPLVEQQRLWHQALAAVPGKASFQQVLEYCAIVLRGAELNVPEGQKALRNVATVADNYSLAKRVFGLYPLTSLAFARGVASWHREIREQYMLTPSQLQNNGHLRYYRPAGGKPLAAGEVAEILRRASSNILALPQPSVVDLDTLFDSFAPVFAVDTVSRDDRPGAPRWLGGRWLDVDVSEPIVYRYTSHTRFREQALLQLNYLLWFPARARTKRVDMLAGTLDGIIWRVTLRADGRPLVFDSIHPCGCYHLAFPGPGVRATAQQSRGQEPVLFPLASPLPGTSEKRLLLRIASATHYLQNVSVAGTDILTMDTGPLLHVYVQRPAVQLRSLDWRLDQGRSLFAANGLVTGSERHERLLFWPMGIKSAGAMRQTGHQATAFIGRRHFDDANLFDPLLRAE